MNDGRPPIPTELRRKVLIESGHRCAISTCQSTEVDIHHIVPWEVCKSHEFSNLIALCPNCHRRTHRNEIDRKSLYKYKEELSAAQKIDVNLNITSNSLRGLKVYQVNPNQKISSFVYKNTI